MSLLDAVALAIAGASTYIAWRLAANGRWKTLGLSWAISVAILAASFVAMSRAEDYDGYLYLFIGLFVAGPVVVGLTGGATLHGVAKLVWPSRD